MQQEASLGFFNVDKPAGMTSHDVVAIIRRGTHTKKVGHAGTLDPAATGVLVICWGKATRLSDFVMAGWKGYDATVQLGTETDTYDAEGEIVAQSDGSISLAAVEDALGQFRGAIEQVPPMYSAIKKDGKKLYELARQGQNIEREARAVNIEHLSIEAFDFPKLVLQVRCSSGTYIRSLAHDLGQVLGIGGHLSALRRTAVGDAFTIDHAIPLDDLCTAMESDEWQSHLISVEHALGHIPRLDLEPAASALILNGGFVEAPEATASLLRAYDADGNFIALLERHPKNAHLLKPLKVFA